MLVTIQATTPQPPIQWEGSSPHLRAWYSNDFLAGDGVTPVLGGPQGFFYDVLCSVNGYNNLVIPAFEVQSTTDSNPTARFFGQLYDEGGAPREMIFGGASGWFIPSVYGSIISFDQLVVYNAAAFLVNPPTTFFTADQTIAEIIRLAAAQVQDYSAVGVLGLVRMSVAPDVASEPIAFGVNDPAVGDVHTGALTINKLPRALDSKTLTDSQVSDDGTDVGIQTFNAVELGDFNFNQNGSYIGVNDNEGRANLFAGADAQAQYAGVAAVCGVSSAQIFVQATNYSYLFGESGVLKLGDGVGEQNGTRVEIDDLNQLIKLTNVPISDPAVAGAIWSDAGVLRLSAG